MSSGIARRLLAINEWLFADLLCENGPNALAEALEFLLQLAASQDRVLFPEPSSWSQKLFFLSKQAGQDIRLKLPATILFKLIRQDSNRAVIINPQETEPLESVQEHNIPEEDRYLVRAALTARADILVTTDQRLLEGVNRSDLPFRAGHRDDFLRDYPAWASGGLQVGEAPLS